MKVVFLSPLTPYKENRGGATGLPYHLLKGRPDDIDVVIYSFNSNHLPLNVIHDVENELKVKINLLKDRWWRKAILKLHLSFIRVFFRYPINYYRKLNRKEIEEINRLAPDFIWCYSQEFSGIVKQFSHYRILHTLPDCYSLHFYRRLAMRATLFNTVSRWRVFINYMQYVLMERNYFSSDNILYHLVGKEDRDFLLNINPKLNAFFVRHPHYEIAPTQKVIKFHEPRIKLLLAGRYDLYSQQTSDELMKVMLNLVSQQSCIIKKAYTITFLGKGWERHVKLLMNAGFDVHHIVFAPDYIEEIIKHDIQINPLTIGTGTKGKVLDAISNGLLVLGTKYALENIAVENGKSCVLWNNATEVPGILIDIVENRTRYEQMAVAGRDSVLSEHNPRKVSKELFAFSKRTVGKNN